MHIKLQLSFMKLQTTRKYKMKFDGNENENPTKQCERSTDCVNDSMSNTEKRLQTGSQTRNGCRAV